MPTIELNECQRQRFNEFLAYQVNLNNPPISNWFMQPFKEYDSAAKKDKIIDKLIPNLGQFSLHWNGEDFTINNVEEGVPRYVKKKNPAYYRRTSINHESTELITELINNALRFQRPCITGCFQLFHVDCERAYWNQLNDSYAQSMDNIFIDPSVKEQLDSHISSFLAQRNKYNAFGRPYKLNILLHGVPGSGKSSLVKSIAMKYKRPIYVLSFGKDLTDDKMISLVSQMSDNPILLFEDIDAFFVKRDVNNINVSLSCLLNLLDGTFVRSGMICFLTANQANKLDEALLRPSRIDRVIRFNYPKKEHVAAAYASLVSAPGAMSFEDFYKRIEPTHCEMSGSVEYLFRYGDTPDLEKNMNELLNREQELMLEMEQEGIVPEE